MNATQGTATGVESFFAKIEKLSKVQRILIFAGVFIAIIAIFVFVLYKPKWAEIEKLDKQLTGLEKKLTIAKRNAADLKKFQKQMMEAEVQFKTAMKALPEREEIPSLLTSISRSGQDVGLEFLLFQPKSEIRKEFYAEIPVAMNVKGGYHDLALFFDKVARLSRIVNIKNISMSRDGETLDLNTSCTAVTYKFVEPEPQKNTGKRKKRKK
ncbi:MAG: type 4a pilus biogenesis protein PilO [Desulfobacterales bacterium]|jgi:type IV pilus assembly protein PilO